MECRRLGIYRANFGGFGVTDNNGLADSRTGSHHIITIAEKWRAGSVGVRHRKRPRTRRQPAAMNMSRGGCAQAPSCKSIRGCRVPVRR
jgi:hypothetical protein